MNNDDWKIQVSYRTPTGAMINVRGNTADELSVLLEGVFDYSVQIASVDRQISACYDAAPLETSASTPSTKPVPSSPVTPTPQASPTCIHGARIFRSGISKKTGQPYAFWACPQPQSAPDQCKPVNG